jgi:response regulator RpfG family c-di-GMP phosphodiesterase
MDKKVKLLYVDDEPMNLLLFSRLFGNKYDVKEAESGFRGLEILTENPDMNVVISDMKMPLMNGIEFVSKAKELYPQMHFYILSGYEITKEIQESLAKGLIVKYFQKPFKMAEIDSAIEKELMKG